MIDGRALPYVQIEAPARYATPRDPGAASAGREVATLAVVLGHALMPWQRLVVDVALERDPADPRRWRYPLVVVTVPRQAGKTWLVGCVAVHRAITRRGRMFLTAQKGKDARARWRDLRDAVTESPLGAHVSSLNGAGTESLRFPNGAEVKPFAPVRDALHGETPPLVILDEAWSFDAARGEDLMQAIRPAQITLADRQLWIISTAGTAASTFLRELVDAGRLAVGDLGASIAYFEWSAAEGLDPYDPDTWSFHPALGHTITVADLAAEAEASTRGNFERAYLNRWTVSTETIIDPDLFDARAEDDQTPPEAGHLALSYEVAQDRSRSSVFAGWTDAAGRVHVRAVLIRPGVSWLLDEIPTLIRTLSPTVVLVDDGGPTRPVTDALERAGVEVAKLGYRDYATACGAFLARLHDDEVGHDGSPALRESILSARLRYVSDQRAYDRRNSAGPIDALIAAALASWAATHQPVPMPAPYVRGAVS